MKLKCLLFWRKIFRGFKMFTMRPVLWHNKVSTAWNDSILYQTSSLNLGYFTSSPLPANVLGRGVHDCSRFWAPRVIRETTLPPGFSLAHVWLLATTVAFLNKLKVFFFLCVSLNLWKNKCFFKNSCKCIMKKLCIDFNIFW